VNGLVDRLLNLNPALVYVVVTALITLLGAVALGVDGACQEGCPSLLCRESDSANSANATRTRS
jgi:hypothetical protein